ncbi:MAG TPA: uracil-DNA glycosylase [Bacilli bacterium]|jgi:uracil-DNA glycosylase|nr:uracil-DNA glycosylase [Bacilli bacterium]HOE07117.1 uracil-DNA glycosylase [Bacilli bacterium]HOH62191.1 uracil-DNA glycosylase [Bacilli bacterium]HQM07406.1 uracil-DNA glycosylase [Bacilli bacterium]
MIVFHNHWDHLLAEEFQKEYYRKLREFLVEEYRTKVIYPSMYDIFKALILTDYEDVKVVILGQDPYHGPGQAHGLCFSVPEGISLPPSLQNIYKEIENDLQIKMNPSGDLTCWAKEGVLLLNTVLTVRANQANSHHGKGWELFTDKIIELLNAREKPIVFILWGNNAKAKIEKIDNPHHLVLTAPHPSPLSAYYGFFGCRHFSKTNNFLKSMNIPPINWQN